MLVYERIAICMSEQDQRAIWAFWAKYLHESLEPINLSHSSYHTHPTKSYWYPLPMMTMAPNVCHCSSSLESCHQEFVFEIERAATRCPLLIPPSPSWGLTEFFAGPQPQLLKSMACCLAGLSLPGLMSFPSNPEHKKHTVWFMVVLRKEELRLSTGFSSKYDFPCNMLPWELFRIFGWGQNGHTLVNGLSKH